MAEIYEFFLKQVQKMQPENLQISEQLGRFYFEEGNVGEAIRVYEVIVKNHPDYVNGYFWLGFLYEEKGNSAKAINY